MTLVSCSGIGWFLCAAGRSQDGSHGDGRQLIVGDVDLARLSFSLRDTNSTLVTTGTGTDQTNHLKKKKVLEF